MYCPLGNAERIAVRTDTDCASVVGQVTTPPDAAQAANGGSQSRSAPSNPRSSTRSFTHCVLKFVKFV